MILAFLQALLALHSQARRAVHRLLAVAPLPTRSPVRVLHPVIQLSLPALRVVAHLHRPARVSRSYRDNTSILRAMRVDIRLLLWDLALASQIE